MDLLVKILGILIGLLLGTAISLLIWYGLLTLFGVDFEIIHLIILSSISQIQVRSE